MKGVIIRIAFIFIVSMFISIGVFVVLIGGGGLDHWMFEVVGPEFVSPQNDKLIMIGMIILLVSMLLSLVVGLMVPFDKKDIPMQIISRIEIQNKVFLIVDQEIFERDSIQWGKVDLHHVRKRVFRNFFYFNLNHNLYIKPTEEVIYELQTEELLTFDELRTEFKESEFKLGEADDPDKDQKEKNT